MRKSNIRALTLLIVIGLNLIPFLLFAADGHHDEGIPFQTIMYQAINLAIVIGILVYFVTKPAKQFFIDKKSQFVEAANKAQAIQKSAEQEFSQIKGKLSKLQSTTDESLAKARADAADLKKQLIAEAQAASKRIEEESKNTIELELQKAKQNLRDELIQEAVALARGNISSKVSKEDHKRLEGDFINNIRVLNQ